MTKEDRTSGPVHKDWSGKRRDELNARSESPVLYTFNEKQKFYNKDPFPSQLKMVIIGNSGSGKTKLLFKFLLEGYLYFQKLVFESLSLSQKEYDVIIKSFQKGLSIN